MAVRTGYAGTQNVGDVLTSANFTKMPGGLVGYLQITSPDSARANNVAVAGLSVTFTAGTSRLYKVTAYAPKLISAATGDVGLLIYNVTGSAQLNEAYSQLNGGAATWPGVTVTAIVGLGAGSTNIEVRARCTGGGNTIATQASATAPATILIEDVGPSF